MDLTLNDARPEQFDALLIPGGLINPGTLRSTPAALKFTRHFFEQGKPVAAISHAPWVLIDAGVVRDRKITSWAAIQTDVTSRKPDDTPAFNRKMIEEFAEGRREKQVESTAS